MTECNAKFAGRRKPGGGYTYYDFMQNRSFDIAGPNPTAEEQKKIDEQYTAFLEQERRNSIAAAIFGKQQQLQQQAPLKDEKEPPPAAAPRSRDRRPRARSSRRPRAALRQAFILLRLRRGSRKAGRILKKLFSPSPSKAKRS